MKFFAILLFAATAVWSCVSARRIEMQYQGSDTATVTWRMKEDSIGLNPFVLSNSQELRFDLFAPRRKHIKLSFGSGGWSPTEVARLAMWLESVEMKTPTGLVRLDSTDRIRDFLLARRKGVGGGRIVINLQ